MTTEGMKERLTAIFSADVKGYSRLMSQDRIGTIETLKSCREAISSLVQRYEGRVIDSPGDNILAAFGSASNAVNCAVEIQRELTERNAEVPSARRMEWRIGINLGDVVEDDGRIYGDGVNIAARVEGLAEPGGICISGTVYDQIQEKLGLEYESLGEQKVKNIARPVRVYRVLSYPGAHAHGVVTRRWHKATLAVLAVALLCLGSALTWNYMSQPATPPPVEIALPARTVAPAQTSKTSLSAKPSIAVLPFTNMSNDPEQEYFSDGMAEEILNGLAKIPGLIVKARTSSFAFKGKNQDIRKIGELLNVTHILEGSVRKSGNRVRVTAQLIATGEDAHIWSERYDRELTDVFAVQDEISGAILGALNVHLVSPKDTHVRTANMQAYDAYLLGRYQSGHLQWDEAVAFFEKAVSIDPDYADAYGALAYTHSMYIWWEITPTREKLPIVRRYIDKALSLNPNQFLARLIKGWNRFLVDRDYQGAIDEFAALERKYPNEINILVYQGLIFQAIGRFDLALTVNDRIMELDPLNPVTHLARGVGFIITQRFDEARQSYRKMKAFGMRSAFLWAWLALSEGDTQAIQEQLDRGEADWGYSRDMYPFFEAAVYYLKGDHDRMRERLISFKQEGGKASHKRKHDIALLEGDLDSALDYYAQALSGGEYTAFREVQMNVFCLSLFPGYRSHPKYQKMLRDVGLDKESVDRLKIPPLPY